MPLLERARVEVYVPDLPAPHYRNLLLSFEEVRTLSLPLAMWLMLVLGCAVPQNERSSPNKETTASKVKISGEALPVTASAYEDVEPWATQRIETVNLTERFARRTFKDRNDPKMWHELIIGTGNDSERIYAYFDFVPLDALHAAERDERELRWGLLFAKYAVLAGIPPRSLTNDLDLARECKDKAVGFYMGLRKSTIQSEGVDIRGIHLDAKRYKGNTAVIIGLTSDQWNDIRHAIMRGQKHELYSLFPVQ